MKLRFIICAVLLQALPLATPEPETTAENNTLVLATNKVKRPDCQSQCGNLVVPYPFGIGEGCSISPQFEINCSTASDPPKAFSFSQEIINITDSTMRVANRLARRCYNSSGGITDDTDIWMDFTNTPYIISVLNTFTVIGCYSYAWLSGSKNDKSIWVGCLTFCSEMQDDLGGECSGSGCCQTSIPKDLTNYTTQLRTLQGSDNITRTQNSCTYAFLGEQKAYKFNGTQDFRDPSFRERIQNTVPVVLEWAIGNLSCLEAQKSKDDYACQSNSDCVGRDDSGGGGGYRCVCKQGYQGNPYLPSGCEDIDECADGMNYPCHGICNNIPGNYTCECRSGYKGNAKVQDSCHPENSRPFPVLQLSLGIGFGFLTILCSILVLYFTIKKRRLILLREKFFEQNGGVLLKQKLNTQGGGNLMTIYSVGQLKEATNNYAEDRILGQGGFGTVYKGILPDNRVVAIKKSQKVDQGQREQFINEVEILTQINHRNVVKLLGCCLETEVPLLVYEFVPNDTLFHHIGMRRLSWDSRLRIACETAGALAYLHSAASMPIIHRDVKSSNILLDGSYTTKVADFGASRLVPLVDDQVATLVQGTLGYLDPEYLYTGQLTDKSDVYSFGVVLAELLTGKKPLGGERIQEEQNLVTYFVMSMRENRLFEILEPQVAKEASVEQLKEIGELVKRCLNLVGDNRPAMKEVAMELETLRKLRKHPLVNQDGYNETSSIMIEAKQTELYTLPLIPYSDTFGEFSSSSTQMNEFGLQVHSPR